MQRGPPPPTYDECMKANNAAGPTTPSQPHQYTYTTPTPYQQQQVFQPPPPLAQQTYGYANPYQTHMQQQQIFYNTATPSTVNTTSTPGNVLYLAKGAKVRTTATGGISIPPPPPGCAATPAQLAAMSGQQVMIKKQKKSFF